MQKDHPEKGSLWRRKGLACFASAFLATAYDSECTQSADEKQTARGQRNHCDGVGERERRKSVFRGRAIKKPKAVAASSKILKREFTWLGKADTISAARWSDQIAIACDKASSGRTEVGVVRQTACAAPAGAFSKSRVIPVTSLSELFAPKNA